MDRDVEFLMVLFEKLDVANIKYAVLRKAEKIHTGHFNDVDWAVEYKYYKNFINMLKQVCKQLNWNIDMIIHKDGFKAIRLHSKGDKIPKLLHFDLFNTFSWRGIEILSNKELLEDRYKINCVYSSNKAVESMIQFLTRYLFNGYVKEEYRENIQYIFRENRCQVNKKFQDLFGVNDCEKLMSMVEKSEWKAIEENVSYYRNVVIKQQKYKNKRKYLLGQIKYKIYTFNRVFKRPGLMVVFEGTDGSGKSTIIENLPKIMYRSYDESYIDYYHWRPKVIRSPKNVSGATVTDPHKKKPYSKVVSFFKLMFFNIDYILGYWLKVRWQMAKGHIVIFDRYYYDYYIDKNRYRLNVSDRLLDFMKLIIPKPDLTFLLVGDAQALYERKKEISIEEIRLQIDRLIRNANRFYNSVIIDVNQGIQDVGGDVCNEILAMLTVRNKFNLMKEG